MVFCHEPSDAERPNERDQENREHRDVTEGAQTKLKITIWQPYFTGFMLAIGQGDSSWLNILDGDTELQREVLSSRFIDAFQPMLPPADRSLNKLEEFLEELRAVASSPASEWSPSATTPLDVGTPPTMVNNLLALTHQLTWLVDVFRDLPGASVSIR
jgi:hypothetical protein